MQKIKPNLWFDSEADSAVDFYLSVFGGEKLETCYFTEAGFEQHGRPAGSIMTVDFQIRNYRIAALNGGPVFKLNPSLSFMVNFSEEKEVDETYRQLAEGGLDLMPLDRYDFSKRYAWVQDRFGMTWQLIHEAGKQDLRLLPAILFVGSQYGRLREAHQFYTSIFPDSSIGTVFPYGPNKAPDQEDALAYSDFKLAGKTFVAMESAQDHKFQFDEAFSFVVDCKNQQEIDEYWHALSADPEAGICGWTKDKFGFSWQIVPEGINRFFSMENKSAAERAMNALLEMKKIDVHRLEEAFNG